MRVPCALLLLVVAVLPVGADVEGLWATRLYGEVEFNEYIALELDTDGYLRTRLSDETGRFHASERGIWELVGGSLRLTSQDPALGPLVFEARGDSLLAGEPLLHMRRDAAPDWDRLVGTWEPVGLGDVDSWIELGADGILSTNISTLQSGPYRVAGSALVWWAEVAADEDFVGRGGLWFDVELDGDIMRYRIFGTARIETRRRPTSVRVLSWGQLKGMPGG